MKNISTSPTDNKDLTAKDFLDFSTELPTGYIAPYTDVRCQGFSSQDICFAVTSALSQYEKLKTGEYNLYSPGFIYASRDEKDFYNQRWCIRTALKKLQKDGVCLERDFPFANPYKSCRRKFKRDAHNLVEKAQEHKITDYFRCYSEDEIKRCIMQKGSVIVCCSGSTNIFSKLKYYLTKTINSQLDKHALIIVGGTANNEWILQDSYSILRPLFGKVAMKFTSHFDECGGINIKNK